MVATLQGQAVAYAGPLVERYTEDGLYAFIMFLVGVTVGGRNYHHVQGFRSLSEAEKLAARVNRKGRVDLDAHWVEQLSEAEMRELDYQNELDDRRAWGAR